MSLISVEDALARLLDKLVPTEVERVPLADADGRVLAEDLAATRTQPPFAASAMDGYAVRAADVELVPASLKVIGDAPAGHEFSGSVGPGECVRIFTGAPLPEGADSILIQENAVRDGDTIVANEAVPLGRYVRRAGLDFTQGDVLLKAGTRLCYRSLALAAAMNHAEIPVRRRPRVAVLATGDELVPPGTEPAPDQIVASNQFGIASLTRAHGGEARMLEIARDDQVAIATQVRAALEWGADILVTLGGASVGDHDLVQESLGNEGMELAFWRIAMRPGKPLMFGHLGPMRVLGLPGNPVSSMVCGLLFLKPLLDALLGQPGSGPKEEDAILGDALGENDRRQDYLRARLSRDASGRLVATPFVLQDSSMLATLAAADALIIRAPHAPAAAAGDAVSIVRL
ncbi:gephyrin-like molybdotransferase Glp [Breoghania sp. L-A4]|uniref:molybdopterin molybdotransferase MoeA n=1 Tax=Breoghania sp. L-A4 TaxID=2304600 RepID=UPI000E35D305|nr:gephyrin-like molybdotransferase Glp [Breoghania sp. L-A4]AXS40425.1 molybdopterin molybdenumtransferase MoeA [Breoghania sp. L-A4]